MGPFRARMAAAELFRPEARNGAGRERTSLPEANLAGGPQIIRNLPVFWHPLPIKTGNLEVFPVFGTILRDSPARQPHCKAARGWPRGRLPKNFLDFGPSTRNSRWDTVNFLRKPGRRPGITVNSFRFRACITVNSLIEYRKFSYENFARYRKFSYGIP